MPPLALVSYINIGGDHDRQSHLGRATSRKKKRGHRDHQPPHAKGSEKAISM